jgi:E3 ubiquitin-protein ligase HACE1
MEDVLGPAHNAAFQGDGDSLRGLALANLMAVGANGKTPAHIASKEGHASFLHALHELGAAASLSAADAKGKTPAHLAVSHAT